MKKILIKYYTLIILILFIIVNITLNNLKVRGLLYQIYMTFLIISNITTLITYRKEIKLKNLCAIANLLLTFLFFKNIWQLLFGISNMLALIILGMMESKSMKIITAIIVGLILGNFKFFITMIIIIFIVGVGKERGFNDIYEDTHYYCDNNYEVYAYSAGAMDKYHYSIGKHYEILNLDDIIYINYRQRQEKTANDYANYVYAHNCKKVNGKNGFE